MEARILKLQELCKERQKKDMPFELMHNQAVEETQDKHRLENLNRVIRSLPLRFRGKSFPDYLVQNDGQATAKKVAERYVSSFADRIKDGTPLQFKGNPGTGKTFLALIICQELAKNGYTVKYEPSLDFLKSLLEVRFKSHAAFSSHLSALNKIQMLVIDEITESANKGGAPSELEKQVLFQIINERYQNKLCTLVITNRGDDELTARLGMPIHDRLCEGGVTVGFNWRSYRQQQGNTHA